MIDDTTETPAEAEKFNYSAFPEDTLFHDRRGPDRRSRFPVKPAADSEAPPVPKERRARKERRRRIDPTTFEKQYTDDELEFMNAMQQFKVQTCKSFPSHGDVLRVAYALGYRKLGADPSDELGPGPTDEERVPMLNLVTDSTDD
jgi:hypothetical protein